MFFKVVSITRETLRTETLKLSFLEKVREPQMEEGSRAIGEGMFCIAKRRIILVANERRH